MGLDHRFVHPSTVCTGDPKPALQSRAAARTIAGRGRSLAETMIDAPECLQEVDNGPSHRLSNSGAMRERSPVARLGPAGNDPSRSVGPKSLSVLREECRHRVGKSLMLCTRQARTGSRSGARRADLLSLARSASHAYAPPARPPLRPVQHRSQPGGYRAAPGGSYASESLRRQIAHLPIRGGWLGADIRRTMRYRSSPGILPRIVGPMSASRRSALSLLLQRDVLSRL